MTIQITCENRRGLPMKIRPEHIAYMRAAILANSKAPTLTSYLARGLTEKRWRWDLLYMAGLSQWICNNLYPYANDEHIDTALRHITHDPTLERSMGLARKEAS